MVRSADGMINGFSKNKLLLALLLAAMLFSGVGCSVYFNTFFNCKKAFNSAEKARKKSPTGVGGQAQYQVAIEKATKVVDKFPDSKYYDDALYILGVSYYHTEKYSRAERRFRELLANYPESKFHKKSNLYLAKSKLQLGDISEAMVIFQDIFKQDYEKEFKGEAAEALGQYYFEDKNYEESRQYFLAVRDSLGDEASQRRAQVFIADGYYDSFRFNEALGAYLQVLGMEPDNAERYHAMYRAALCSYRLQRIDEGIIYLEELQQDDLFYDSLGILQLTIAEGLEYDDDLIGAEAAYEEVASTAEKPQWVCRAYYRLGLIYQFDYDLLIEAKEYYDKAIGIYRQGDDVRDALQRSSDIGKLSDFARNPLDSAATPAAIDEAAYTQYLLAELYWFNLDKPDSAMIEMQYLIDSFGTAYYAPKALIGLAEMYRQNREDNHAADSLLKLVLTKYPKSDYVPEALAALGLQGTAADTGYAELYLQRAEDFWADEGEVDSARVNYQYIVDNFPDSKYHLLAQFSLIWLTETFEAPGDSSVILAYQEFADSFPSSELASEARQRISGRSSPRRERKEETEDETGGDSLGDTLFAYGEEADTALEYIDPMLSLYFRPNGDSLVDLKLEPIEILEEFEFPAEAASESQNDWRLFFQIKVDFSGEVIDYVLKIPSGVEEIDERAKQTVGSMTFDGMDVANRLVSAGMSDASGEDGYWFVYEYKVVKPDYLR